VEKGQRGRGGMMRTLIVIAALGSVLADLYLAIAMMGSHNAEKETGLNVRGSIWFSSKGT
jgi:hypothetical protein